MRGTALLQSAPRVFVAGAGRSGLCMMAFGMRLMHLGIEAYVVGETITPSIRDKDLFVIASGSGQTCGLVTLTRQALRQGADILLFTTEPTSTLAGLADQSIIIPAASMRDEVSRNIPPTIQPMGTLFEQSLLILCDSLILCLMEMMDVDEAQLRLRHTNLE